MRVKIRTPDRFVIGFSRREIALISNCLGEASSGMLKDRFVPAHDQLVEMLGQAKSITSAKTEFDINPAAV